MPIRKDPTGKSTQIRLKGAFRGLSQNKKKRGPIPQVSLTHELIERACGYIKEGDYLETAFAILGVPRPTWKGWIIRGNRDGMEDTLEHELAMSVQQARAEAEHEDVQFVRGADRWEARAWMLERKSPDRWGKRDTTNMNMNISAKDLSDDDLIKAIQSLLADVDAGAPEETTE